MAKQEIPSPFKRWSERVFGEDLDKIDIDAFFDSTLTVEENKAFFIEHFPVYFTERYEKYKPTVEDLKTAGNDEQSNKLRGAESLDCLRGKPIKCVAIVGETRSGKTALMYDVAQTLAGKRKQYVFRHPNRELANNEGFGTIESLADIEKLHDCVLMVDEPQTVMQTYDRKANEGLTKLMSLCGQRNILLILCTSDTRFVTRGIEAYVDAWFITDLDYELVKRGSVIQKAIRQHTFLDPAGYRCVVGTTLFYCRKFPDISGYKRYDLPDFWSEQWSRPYYFCQRRTEARPQQRIEPRTEQRIEEVKNVKNEQSPSVPSSATDGFARPTRC